MMTAAVLSIISFRLNDVRHSIQNLLFCFFTFKWSLPELPTDNDADMLRIRMLDDLVNELKAKLNLTE